MQARKVESVQSEKGTKRYVQTAELCLSASPPRTPNQGINDPVACRTWKLTKSFVHIVWIQKSAPSVAHATLPATSSSPHPCSNLYCRTSPNAIDAPAQIPVRGVLVHLGDIASVSRRRSGD